MSDTLSNFDLAVAAYRDSCDRNNLRFHQPSEAYSKQMENVVYLRTSPTSFVARYDIRRRRILA
jgi:hypothetical protein